MEVQPTLEFVQWNQEVNISINLIPTEPVKAYELQILFDPSFLQVNSVEQGDFFRDYQSFYSNGEIDNFNGTIIKLYALVLGQGVVTEEGTILILHCTTSGIGLSPIVFNESRITNETQYISLNIMNGAIQVYGEFYPWDCNEDGTCNYLDISILVTYYGELVSPPGSEPADILEDGVVNYLDISALISHY